MELVHENSDLLKEVWFTIYSILVQLAGVIVYDYRWGSYKPSEENLKRVPGGFVALKDGETVTYPMQIIQS